MVFRRDVGYWGQSPSLAINCRDLISFGSGLMGESSWADPARGHTGWGGMGLGGHAARCPG